MKSDYFLNKYFLVSPLNFWETNEVNMSNQDSPDLSAQEYNEVGIFKLYKYIGNDATQHLTDLDDKLESTNLNFIQRTQAINEDIPVDSAAWYAKDSNGSNISSIVNVDLYSDFINYENSNTPSYDANPWQKSYVPPDDNYRIKINIAGIGSGFATNGNMQDIESPQGEFNNTLSNFHSTEKLYPYEAHELKDGRSSGITVIEENIYISFPKFSLLNNITPVYAGNSSLSNKINNNYLKKSKLKFYSKEFFENNFGFIDSLEENVNNLSLNEKLYKSSCFKYDKNSRQREKSNIDFIYKIKKYNDYNIVSIEGLYNEFSLFKKKSIIEDELMYIDDRDFNLEIYEDKLYDNRSYISQNISQNNIPYFYIDLESSVIYDESNAGLIIGNPVFENIGLHLQSGFTLTAGSNEVKTTSNMKGWYIGSTLTKTDSVGDGEFGRKSQGKIAEMIHGGATVVIVSHEVETINSLCDKAFYMTKGKIASSGDLEEATSMYRKL